PVLLRTTTRISHGKSPVSLTEPLPRREITTFEQDRPKLVMIPAYARVRHVLVEERQRALAKLASCSPLNRLEWGGRSLGIVASGIAYHYAREVYPEASFLKLGFPYPFPADLLAELAAGVERLVIVEELDRFLELHARAAGIEVEAKPDEFLTGELSPEVVSAIVDGGAASSISAKPRPPALCAGCPHRGVFYVLSRLGLIVTGDIGCYTLGVLPPLSSLDTCLCMGAGINHMHGLRKVLPREQAERVVAVIGDSTFVHSGITGVVDIVYDNSDGLVIILDNATTAMTGRQDHPGTGKKLSGDETCRLDLEGICRASGVPWVRTVNPYDLEELRRAIEEGRRTGGPAVLIARAACLLIDRRRGTPPVVDVAACVGCGACHDLGCPAIKEGARGESQARGRTGPPVIDGAVCTGCGLCVEVCRIGAIKGSAGGG
ncbi:MAG TPA: indolepyruvate ferredoxin oxidoreductase subunit alpha, partial [Alphaproteobacteria bacterium]|nr:indolepyruvate ferredoxin oxidoreductase subunit alpha [Alphaproteobacteria bacterium]